MHRLRKVPNFTRQFSASKAASSSSSSPIWRTRIKENQIVTQISSILLQRRNWFTLLQNLHFSSRLTPSLFLQILHKTQHHPQISLDFFNWAKTRFKPDLKCLCRITQICIGAGKTQQAKPVLDSLIQTHPSSLLVETMIQASRRGSGSGSRPKVFYFVLECYARKGLFIEAMEVFGKMRVYNCTPSVGACNALLECLVRENEFRLVWCLHCAVVKSGVSPDSNTWSLLAHVLCKSGRFERIVRWLDMGFCNSVLYNLVVDCYSKAGDFGSAFESLNEMCGRKLHPGFSTYSSILDGACKHEDVSVIERMIGLMVDKELLPGWPSEYDSILQKLCDSRKMYAVQMLYRRACNEKVRLHNATYGCMLRTFSEEGGVVDAISLHRVISQKNVAVKDSCYNALINALCKQDPSVEVSKLLIELIGRGFTPCASELSKCVTSLSNIGRWREAEDILNAILEKGVLLDSFCCCSLMEHYCSTRQLDSAVALHNKMEKLNGSLDVRTYNVLLDGLSKRRRIDEAVKVFDYMRRHNLVDTESFSIMISGLCREKELRTAMKIHDEMLKMGLKPDKAKYKRLISGFK